MNELYLIYRPNTNQYYHSLNPRGYPLWIDDKEQAQLLTDQEYFDLITLIHQSISETLEIQKS